MFTRDRDWSLMRHLNRELMGNIVTQQCAIYQYQLEQTKVNLYGEASEEKYFDGPYLFNVFINRANQEYIELDIPQAVQPAKYKACVESSSRT